MRRAENAVLVLTLDRDWCVTSYGWSTYDRDDHLLDHWTCPCGVDSLWTAQGAIVAAFEALEFSGAMAEQLELFGADTSPF